MKLCNCHLGREHYARGLCRPCYEIDLRKRNPTFADSQRMNCRKWFSKNKEIKSNLDREYQSNPRNKERRLELRRAAMLSVFGMTIEDENRILGSQNGGCAICGSTGSRRHLDIDHDHYTGKFRGFLCGRCNKAIGLFGDSVENLQKAINYLKNYARR